MIDTKELRRLALDGDFYAIQELVDRFEEVDKERDALLADLNTAKQTLEELIPKYTQVRKERLLLRAKIERMEKQEPAAWIARGGYPVPLDKLEWQLWYGSEKPTLSWDNQETRPLYALPGAKGE